MNICHFFISFKQNIELSKAEMNPYDLLASECAAQEGASDADIKAALAMEMPNTTPGKCLNACIGEKTGIVSNIIYNYCTTCIFPTNFSIYFRYFHALMMKKQMKNNKLDVETTIEMTKIDFSNDPKTIQIVTDISKECADVTGKMRSKKCFQSVNHLCRKNIYQCHLLLSSTDEDRCEAAYKIIICTDNAAKSRGLVFNR